MTHTMEPQNERNPEMPVPPKIWEGGPARPFGAPPTPTPAYEPEDDATTKQIYQELFSTVKSSLLHAINKAAIEAAVERVIGTFSKQPNSRLLLYTYTSSHDNYIIAHITNNVILAVGFGVFLGLAKQDLMDLGCAAVCHDFGMSEYTHLFQRGHQLTAEENKIVQNHPVKSAERVQGIFSEKIITTILSIHETASGQGYPQGKTDIEIPVLAKIISICDVFEALTHPRNFRKEFTPYEAMKMIIKKKAAIFSEQIVKRFVDFMSIYPIGSLVYLNTGESAIVVGSNRGLPTRSIVNVLLTPKREIVSGGKILNLLQDAMVYISGIIEPKGEAEILRVLKPRGDFII